MSTLTDAIIYHVDYYKAAEENPSRRSILDDLRKDATYPAMMADLGIDAAHSRARQTFDAVAWPIVRQHLGTAQGWWAMSRGRGARFFHESYTSPEMPEWCAYAANLRIEQRDQDAASLKRIVRMTKEQCAKHGQSFDPEYDIDGELVAVRTWKFR